MQIVEVEVIDPMEYHARKIDAQFAEWDEQEKLMRRVVVAATVATVIRKTVKWGLIVGGIVVVAKALRTDDDAEENQN